MSEFEKYGVLEDPDTAKTAEETKEPRRCPDCNSELVSSTKVNVLVCPQCGTKPFER